MNRWLLIFCVPLIAISFPEQAAAFQSHPAPEGLYVHQLAHVLLVVALTSMAYWLQKNRLVEETGWRLIQISCLIFSLWSLLTMFGHWVEENIPAAALVGEPDWTQRISMSVSVWTTYFYVLKLDHLISVPAAICLFLGARSLFLEAKVEARSD